MVLLIAAGVVVYLVWDNYFNDKKEDRKEGQGTEQVEEKEVAETTEAVEKEKDEAEKAVEEKKVNQYEGDDPNTAEELSGVVTYAGVNNGVLMVRVNIDQYLDSGKCELSLVKGGGVAYNATAEIAGGASTASCAGFDVPAFGLQGGYEIVINLESGGRKGTIRGEVNI